MISSQPRLPKLPNVQKTYCCKFSALLKYANTLIIAAVKLPNINPIMRIDMVFFTFFATIITAPSTKKAPRLAANARPKLENAIPAILPEKIETPKTNMATPKLAPELIPNTKGPANGFLNKVCINKPQIDKPEPTKTAVMALGILYCKMIYCQDSLAISFPVRVYKIDLRGISTDPKLMFMRIKIINNNTKSINFTEYLE